MSGNGNEPTSGVYQVLDPRAHDPRAAFGDVIDTGNPGRPIIENNKDLPSMLKTLRFRDDNEAIIFSRALAWCQTYNRPIYKDGKIIGHRMDKRIEQLKQRASAGCSVKGLFIHLYAETTCNVMTTDTEFKKFNMFAGAGGNARERNNNNDTNNNKYSGKRP